MKKNLLLLCMGLFVISSSFGQTLKFHFPFNDNVTDVSSNAYVLTPRATAPAFTPVYVTGKFGNAIQLNGTSDYLDLLTTPGVLDPSAGPYSICAWVFNTELAADRTTPDDQENIIHQLTGTGRVLLQVTTNITADTMTLASWASGSKYKALANCFTFGVWQHVAVTSDPVARTHKFYVNGVLVGTATTATAFETNSGGLRIGAHRILTNNAFWHGLIDELYLFSGELSSAQINNIMNSNTLTPNSVSKVDANSGLNVYPNPANGIVNVECSEGIKSIVLQSLDGRNVMLKQNVSSMDVSKIASGNYILKIENNQGVNQYKKISVMH